MLWGQIEQPKEPNRLKRLDLTVRAPTSWRCTKSEQRLGRPDQAGQEVDSTTMGNTWYCHLLCLWLVHGHLRCDIYVPALWVCYLLPLQCLTSNNILLTSTRLLMKPPRVSSQKHKWKTVHQVNKISPDNSLNTHAHSWQEIQGFFRVKVILNEGSSFAAFLSPYLEFLPVTEKCEVTVRRKSLKAVITTHMCFFHPCP